LLELNVNVDIITSYMSNMKKTETAKQLFHDVVLRKLNPENLEIVNSIMEYLNENKELFEMLAQTVGMHYYSKGDYVEAINWLSDRKPESLANQIAKKMIDILMLEGRVIFEKKIEFNKIKEDHIQNSGKLIFIAKYLEFDKLVNLGKTALDFEKAAQILIEIINDKMLPLQYADIILENALSIIKDINIRPVFSTEHLELLMQIITDYEANNGIEKISERAQKVRVGLMEAYQTAILNE